MENITQMIMLSDASLGFYLLDFVILLGFMSALRLFTKMIADISLKGIVSEQNNVAAGITLAGAIIAVAILMMGVVSGEAGNTYVEEITLMVAYGVAAMLFMWLTRKTFDNLLLTGLSVHNEILKGNVAVGVVDAFNMIATAIIVRAAMTWVDGSTLLGLAVVAGIFVISQLFMFLATLYRRAVFQSRHKTHGKTLQGELKKGNIALAIRFSGHRIGLGLAITATSGLVVYDPDLLVYSIIAWTIMAFVIFFAQTILSIALRYVLLPSVNIGEEVVEQQNVAIGAIEAAIYIGIGLAFVGLLA